MNQRTLVLASIFTLSATQLLRSTEANAQQTPGQLGKFAPDLSAVDSVVTEDAAGNIGVGFTNPNARLHVNGSLRLDNGGFSQSSVGNFDVDAPFIAGGRLRITGDGNVGIGTNTPAGQLHLGGPLPSLYLVGETAANQNGLRVHYNEAQRVGVLDVKGTAFAIRGESDPTGGGGTSRLFVDLMFGNVGIGTNSPAAKLDVAGTTRTRVLQITGGSDLSEKFEMTNADREIKPGMVVAIDPHHAGKLVLSAGRYDRRVAGVISGAGGVQPGMLMGQSGTLADGDHPVALTGRVHVWADASSGAIAPGDSLTTSGTPGHAMKVKDFARAQGAILGKAMTGLKEGKGLVLVLVTLQ